MARIVTVTPNPLLDLLAAEEVRPGTVNRTRGFAPTPGGKGINVARVLVAHGHAVTACGFAGGHFGRLHRELVAGLGIDEALTTTAARLRIGFLAGGDGAPTSLLERGFAVAQDERHALCAQVRDAVASAELMIVGGSVPCPDCEGLLVDLAAIAAETGTPCWIDSYGAPMHRALGGPHPPTCAKPNREEFAGSDRWRRCREVHRSDGGGELWITIGEEEWRVDPPPVEEVNPVGSGDCYLAGLAHATLEGRDDAARLAYAAGCGAANAERRGVADFDPSRAAALASRARVGRIRERWG